MSSARLTDFIISAVRLEKKNSYDESCVNSQDLLHMSHFFITFAKPSLRVCLLLCRKKVRGWKRCTRKLLNAWAWFALIFNFAAAHSLGESKSWKLLLFYTHTSCVTHLERSFCASLRAAAAPRVHKYAWTQAEQQHLVAAHLSISFSLTTPAFAKLTLCMFYLRVPRGAQTATCFSERRAESQSIVCSVERPLRK